MEKKINVAELLKDCPQGMELDCAMFENLEFDRIEECSDNFIVCRVKTEFGYNIHTFTKYGCYFANNYAKCVIFPKGKTTWEGFVPPCKFKMGDVLVSKIGNIVLLSHIDSKDRVNYHCIIPTYGSFRIEENTSIGVGRYYDCVLANEQQIQRMYDKIKSSGYKYNQNTNKLEKLIEPKFKVGDRIKNKNSGICDKVIKIFEDCYLVESCLDEQATIDFDIQDNWELVPNKFDITTLKPFDKVLTRANDNDAWVCNLYSHRMKDYYVVLNAELAKQCVPYEGNEHLLGTSNDCDDFYKTW